MGLLNLFFGGGLNSTLVYAILFTLIAIFLIILDRMLFGFLPNVIVGIGVLLALSLWIYYFSGNFLKNSWSTPIGKGIILAVSFILLALILTTSFSKQKTIFRDY